MPCSIPLPAGSWAAVAIVARFSLASQASRDRARPPKRLYATLRHVHSLLGTRGTLRPRQIGDGALGGCPVLSADGAIHGYKITTIAPMTSPPAQLDDLRVGPRHHTAARPGCVGDCALRVPALAPAIGPTAARAATLACTGRLLATFGFGKGARPEGWRGAARASWPNQHMCGSCRVRRQQHAPRRLQVPNMRVNTQRRRRREASAPVRARAASRGAGGRAGPGPATPAVGRGEQPARGRVLRASFSAERGRPAGRNLSQGKQD